MLALSIRQPYAEMILRGVKRVEYRSRPTKLIGRRFYIYAARKSGIKASGHQGIEGAADAGWADGLGLDALPRGVIVGSAVIRQCVRPPGTPGQLSTDNCQLTTPLYEWHLTDVKRYKRPRRVKRQPQPVWFRPFS